MGRWGPKDSSVDDQAVEFHEGFNTRTYYSSTTVDGPAKSCSTNLGYLGRLNPHKSSDVYHRFQLVQDFASIRSRTSMTLVESNHQPSQ